jgi:hypothetical protein
VSQLFLDIGANAVVGQTIVPAALTITTNGSAIDLVDMVANMASAIVELGAVSGTQGTFDIKMQSSTTTGSGWADISGATFTTLTTSTGVQIISFQVPQRYVRAVATAAGTFTSMLFGVSVFGQRAAVPSAKGGWVNEAGGS